MARLARNTFLLVKSYTLPHDIRCQLASNLLVRVICSLVGLLRFQSHSFLLYLRVEKYREEGRVISVHSVAGICTVIDEG